MHNARGPHAKAYMVQVKQVLHHVSFEATQAGSPGQAIDGSLQRHSCYKVHSVYWALRRSPSLEKCKRGGTVAPSLKIYSLVQHQEQCLRSILCLHQNPGNELYLFHPQGTI